MFYIAILLLIIGLTSLLLRKRNNKNDTKHLNNRYVQYHKAYINDEMQYKAYLDWCAEKGKIPMNEKGFEDIRKRRDDLKELLESEV